MDFRDFVPVIGIILNVSRGDNCCSQMVSLRTGNGVVNFIVNEETMVVDNRQLRPGMRVAAFYDRSLPVPLIFPPQYRAQIITVLDRNEQILLNRFNRNLVAVDNSIQLNISANTVVRTENGQNFTCSPGGRVLLVYYTTTTRSLPPQTTPRRIIVMCEED